MCRALPPFCYYPEPYAIILCSVASSTLFVSDGFFVFAHQSCCTLLFCVAMFKTCKCACWHVLVWFAEMRCIRDRNMFEFRLDPMLKTSALQEVSAYIRVLMYLYMCTDVLLHTHAHTYSCMHIHTCTKTRTCIHTHTDACLFFPVRLPRRVSH